MKDVLYMLGVVAVGFALNFGLRAIPFMIFGSRKGELPPWVARFGNFVSPVIIAGLIIYSYSGLQWRTVWPYLAGAVTVGLHLWKRNPLTSIIVGTVLYMCLINCGCTTQRIIDLDAENPSVRVATKSSISRVKGPWQCGHAGTVSVFGRREKNCRIRLQEGQKNS